MIAASACLAACGETQKTKLVCVGGAPDGVFFSFFDARHGGKPASMDLPRTDARGVCDKMAAAAKEIGLKVERTNETTLLITGTDLVRVVYIHPGDTPFQSPTRHEDAQ